MEEQVTTFYSWRGTLNLWVSILWPPVAWAIQMQLNYLLVRRACSVGSKFALYGVTILALATVVFAAALAFTDWKFLAARSEVQAPMVLMRSRFMAGLGLLIGAMFFVVIFAQGLASIIFHPCQL